jgi:LPS-assembly lipoprotein
MALKFLLILGLTLMAGCGFQFRGQAALPFDSAYIDAKPDSVVGNMLRNQLRSRSKLADLRNKASIVIILADESRDKSILTLSGAGKVQEYRLVHKVTLSASDPSGEEILPPSTIQQNRDFTYNSQQVLAEDALESSLHHDMDTDTLQQIMRRLAYIHRP